MRRYQQVGTRDGNEYLQNCVDVFRDRVDYSVENSIPVYKAFTKKLQELCTEHKTFITDEIDVQTVRSILQVGR